MKEQLEVLISAYEYMQKLYGGIQDTVEYFRVDNNVSGMELTIEVIDGMQWLIKALEGTAEIQKEPVDIAEINDTLEELVNALENEDTVLLADLFEYELLDRLQEWYDKVCNSLEVLVPQED